MVEDNVTDMRAHKIADLIVAEWLDSMSDACVIWQNSYDALNAAKAEVPEDVVEEARRIAIARWNRLHNVVS